MKKIKNIRSVERKSCHVPVDPRLGESERMRTVDISREGLGLECDHPMTVGQEVAVRMDLSARGDSVLVWGKVRWVRRLPGSGSYRLGIGFTEYVPNSSPTRLRKYLDSVRS